MRKEHYEKAPQLKLGRRGPEHTDVSPNCPKLT